MSHIGVLFRCGAYGFAVLKSSFMNVTYTTPDSPTDPEAAAQARELAAALIEAAEWINQVHAGADA